MRNSLEDALYELGYDNTLVDTLIARNVIDFSTVDYTRHIIYQLEEHYGEAALWQLEDAVALEGVRCFFNSENSVRVGVLPKHLLFKSASNMLSPNQ